MRTYAILGLLALGITTSTAPLLAQTEWTSSRPDGHAPIGVMGDHTHEARELMLSYRFMRMTMEGSRASTDAVADADIVSTTGPYGFMVTPTRMPMTMHMVGAMFAPSDVVTLMVMANYIDSSMDHVMRNGNLFTTESSGLGDLMIGGLIGLKREGSTRVHLNAGVSIPTGSVTAQDVTPMSTPAAVQLPYAMQLGSGTVDLNPGLTVLGMTDRASWGFQTKGVVRIGENERNWKLGNRLEGTGWVAFKANSNVSFSARALVQRWGDVGGTDDDALNPMMAPTMRRDLRGGSRVDIPIGINLMAPPGALAGHRLLAEFHIPVYQDLHGPQLETDWVLTVGWQKSFAPIGG